jgi:hypothetical protein
MFMMHIHVEVHTSSSNGSFVITIKLQVFFFFHMTTTLSGTFAQSREDPINFVMLARPLARIYQRGSH